MSNLSDAISVGATPAIAPVAPVASQSFVVSNLETTNITIVKLIGFTNFLAEINWNNTSNGS